MRRIAIFVMVLSIAGLCSSCATLLFRGSTEEISVNSDPPGATATLDNGETTVTPFSITVPRRSDVHFHFSKPGYESVDFSDDAEPQPQYFYPDLLVLFIPLVAETDAWTGAEFEHQESEVFVHLDSKEPVSAVTAGRSTASQSPTGADIGKGN